MGTPAARRPAKVVFIASPAAAARPVLSEMVSKSPWQFSHDLRHRQRPGQLAGQSPVLRTQPAGLVLTACGPRGPVRPPGCCRTWGACPSGPKSIPGSATGMGPRTAAPRPSARAGGLVLGDHPRLEHPGPVHFGTAGAVDRARQNAHRPYHAHPERFSHRPPPPAMPTQALTPELAVRNGRVVRRVDDPPSKGCFLIYDHTAENSSSWSTSE